MYFVIGEPPSCVGGSHSTVMESCPLVTRVGADEARGSVIGVTGKASLGLPSPPSKL